MIGISSRLSPTALKILWLIPLAALVIETDLTALIWLGGTAAILLCVAPARRATLAAIYRSLPVTLAIGILGGSFVGLALNPLFDWVGETLTGSQIDLSQFADVHGDDGAYLELLVVGLLFGGIVEELSFRGFFIGWGTELFGEKSAPWLVLLTSLAFGIGHYYQGPAGAISTGLFSLMMGGLYLAMNRRVLPLVVIHMVSNFWGITEIYRHGV